MILAIDPGNEQSGFVMLDQLHDKEIVVRESGVLENVEMLEKVETITGIDYLAVEMIASYGMPVGSEVFDTCVWVGRFMQAFGAEHTRLVYRKDVKLHLCGTSRAKDANIRQALIDRFGGGSAIGRKASPGPLYGVKSHAWAALACAVTAYDADRVERSHAGLL